MNKELIKRQLTFLGFVAGTIILFLFNEWIIYQNAIRSETYEFAPIGLTILQVWLVTKYLHK